MPVVSASELRDFCVALLIAEQMPQDEAGVVADVMLEANLSGVDSHGVSRLASYMDRIRQGGSRRSVKIEVLEDFPAGAVWDACGSFGQPVARMAMEAAMEKARKTGVGFISVCNNNHTGANACHVRQAAEAGFIGMVAGNGPSMVAPFGSATPFFSTNPFSMGYPCAPGVGEFAGETSVIMDMATSVSARGKIILAAKEGRSIPTGWAVDSVGNDTSDPAAALKGALIPFGGHKGYAIAFMVEVLAGLLSGAGTGPSMPDHLGGGSKLIGAGNLFAAVNVELFVGLEHFCKSMREMVDSIRSGVVRPGFSEIMTPGQPEYRTRQRRKEEGIPLSDKVYDELAAEGMRYGLTMPSGR